MTLPPKLLAYGDVVLSLTVRISFNAFIRATKSFAGFRQGAFNMAVYKLPSVVIDLA